MRRYSKPFSIISDFTALTQAEKVWPERLVESWWLWSTFENNFLRHDQEVGFVQLTQQIVRVELNSRLLHTFIWYSDLNSMHQLKNIITFDPRIRFRRDQAQKLLWIRINRTVVKFSGPNSIANGSKYSFEICCFVEFLDFDCCTYCRSIVLFGKSMHVIVRYVIWQICLYTVGIEFMLFNI